MAETLNDVERRVLGVLLEKALAQPAYYPMTLNTIVAACNQKSNRDPVMTLDEDTVWSILEALRTRGLVSRVLPVGSSRVERFRHEAKEVLGWEKPQRAVMAELLLRGPQTLGELRGRCLRMYPFEGTEAVSAVLDTLSQTEPPTVAALPRTPGQSTVRYAHCLYYPEEWAALTQAPAGGVETPASAQPSAPGTESERLRREIENLQTHVAELHQSLAELRRRVETLEG